MEQNDLINLVTKQLKAEILSNPSFRASLVKDIDFKISPQQITEIMSQMKMELANAPLQVPMPKSNAPVITTPIKGKQALKPIVIDPGGIAAKVISDLLEGNNVYLMGKAGTGKTYLAEAIPPVMGQKYFMINCSQWTSPIQIIGGQTIEGYVEGQLIKAWAEGGILILDELPKLDPNTAGLLNDALAKSGSQPKYDEKGNIDEDTIPTITNGRGQVIKKGKDQTDPNLKYRFGVIATGNTNMMDVGNKYAGNQRQDYSLVDRFAGSIYTLDINELTEKRTIYPYVFKVCSIMREYLNEKDALQSVSLRTMLNFNRTFEQENLFKIIIGVDEKTGKINRSPFADEIFDNAGKVVPPKSVQDSIDSFLEMLEPNMRAELGKNSPANEFGRRFVEARNQVIDEKQFILEFMLRYHLDPRKPIDQAPLTQAEIDAITSTEKDPKTGKPIKTFINVDGNKVETNLTFLGS